MRHEVSRTASLMRLLTVLLQLAATTAVGDTELMFNFTKVRQPWADEIQVSEVMLYDEHGGRITAINASNPDGIPSPYPMQIALAAFDLKVSLKWVDVGFSANGFSLLSVTHSGEAPVASCTCHLPH